jgi:hypothetical protein
LLVSNLVNGVDEYKFPSLEKVQTFSHPVEANYILQTRTLPLWNLVVAGGDNGFARVFNRISGQLVSEIHHGGKPTATLIIAKWMRDCRVAGRGQLVQVVEVSFEVIESFFLNDSNVGFYRLW